MGNPNRQLFRTFSLEELLAINDKAKAAALELKTIVSWTDSGTSVTKQFVLPVDVVLDLCLAELQRRDPATYGRSSRIATSRVDRIAL
jgi:hypothetical protein